MSNWAIPGALKIYQMIPPTVTLHGGTCLPDSVSMNILTNHIALTSLERNEMKELNATKEDWLFCIWENICKKLFGVGCKQGHSKTVFLLKEYCFWPQSRIKVAPRPHWEMWEPSSPWHAPLSCQSKVVSLQWELSLHSGESKNPLGKKIAEGKLETHPSGSGQRSPTHLLLLCCGQ